MSARVAVVVPTRNRPQHALACIRSILANPDQDIEVLLMDQSDDDATAGAMLMLRADSRFRLVPTASRGASNARNEGICASGAPLIAFTDDDCRVATDWIARIRAIFERDPGADMVFGRVSIPNEFRIPGAVGADFEPHQREYQTRLPAVSVPWGIGANMSIRRRLIDRVGMFDPLLGPGARFRAGEECDLMIRALTTGCKVVNAVEVEAWHLGVREGVDASTLYRGYGLAMGATLAKHVRLGTQKSVPMLVSWVTHFGALGVRNVLRGKYPTGLGLVAGMLKGVCQSLSEPLDRVRRVYARRGA